MPDPNSTFRGVASYDHSVPRDDHPDASTGTRFAFPMLPPQPECFAPEFQDAKR